VLLRTEDPGPRRRWEDRLSLPHGELLKVVFDNPVARRATIGEAGQEEVWEEIGRILSLTSGDLQRFREEFFAGDRWDAEFLVYLKDLHALMRTGVLSNAWPEARSIQAQWIHPGVFDFILYSGEIHCAKPDPAFFQLAIRHAGCAPDEILFIDDFPENVDAASRMGIQAVLFQNLAQIREYMRRGLE
jgi:HAD superfamily hydrolase (TIGR01509 family)